MPEQAEAPKKKGKLPKSAIVIAGITLLQAGGFFAAFKFFGSGPAPSYGANDHHVVEGGEPEEAHAEPVELPLATKFRVLNSKSGTAYIYDFDISVRAKADKKEALEKLLKNRTGEVSDHLAQIIRSAEPRVLAEDDFRTLRAQIAAALGELAHDPEIVERVLIPRCVPIRAE